MKPIYCKLDFHKASVSKLGSLSNEVRNGIYNNPMVFASPPVTAIAFNTARSEFSKAAADNKMYGITCRTAFEIKRNNLMKILDRMAAYVDLVADGGASIIALSGFSPSQGDSMEVTALNKIASFKIEVPVPGQIDVVIPAINNKGLINYSCICAKGGPLLSTNIINQQFVFATDSPEIRFDCSRGRRKIFRALTPGVQYYFYVYAANSVSVSPLSDVMMVWAM